MKEENQNHELLITMTTEADFSKAHKLANSLLELKLVACVSFTEADSLFWWKSKIDKTREVQLILKSTKDNLKILHETLARIHSYDTPEIISFPVSASKKYADWVVEVMKS